MALKRPRVRYRLYKKKKEGWGWVVFAYNTGISKRAYGHSLLLPSDDVTTGKENIRLPGSTGKGVQDGV